MEERKRGGICESWWFWAILILIVSWAIGYTIHQNKNSSITNISSNDISNNTTNASSNNTNSEITVKPNTSAKIDEISQKAKIEAQNMNQTIKNEAINFIKENKSNLFKDNETMEKAMYYGYLLEYAFEKSNKDLAKLGQDVYQAIKYVYREVETIEDNATQENLRQIEKDLKKIN